jgi:broad specificity phosphatase PhoE
MSQQKRKFFDRPAIVLVIRHAHRNKYSDVKRDNGLSKKGKQQAKKINKYFDHAFPETISMSLISSPKKRCLETIEAISKKRKVEIQRFAALDEGGNLSDKVKWVNRWIRKSKSSVIVLCSHGDLIPPLMREILGQDISLDKGGVAQIEMKGSRHHMRYLFQDFDFFK